jgi:hypothetical protein
LLTVFLLCNKYSTANPYREYRAGVASGLADRLR